MVLIGLEGCDGTGKSTLANAVADEVERRVKAGHLTPDKVELLHRSQPKRPVIEEYATDIEDVTHHLVLDRWHLGELVYSPLYRDTGPFGLLGVAGFRWVEKFLQARGAQFYVVDQTYDVVAERLATRGEDYLQSHHVEHVLQRFREVRALSVVANRLLFVPNGAEHVAWVAHTLVSVAAAAADRCEGLRAFPSYVGGPSPAVLLVGEKRGGQPPFASRACFGPLKNKSGEYLWEALEDPFWRGVGVANACEDDVPALWELLGRPPVVALGSAASAALAGAGISHGAVPHPAKVKRFYNKRQAEYGKLITQVTQTQERMLTWPNSSG